MDDDEFGEFDIPVEEIGRVIDLGQPVRFGSQLGHEVVITYSTLPKMGQTY